VRSLRKENSASLCPSRNLNPAIRCRISSSRITLLIRTRYSRKKESRYAFSNFKSLLFKATDTAPMSASDNSCPIPISEKVFGNNFPYEGAAIFESILKCATKHASAGNASEERDSGKSPHLIEKRIFKYLLRGALP
jgi:hypothetical protein